MKTFALIAAACAAVNLAAALPQSAARRLLDVDVGFDGILDVMGVPEQPGQAEQTTSPSPSPTVARRLVEADAGAFHPEDPDQTGHAKPEITTLGASVDGHTTYRLEAKLAGTTRDIYAIYGDKDNMLMALPPAFQVDHPFGVDIGGVDAEIVAIKGEATYDSWLSIGLTDGSGVRDGVIASTGIDFGGWTKDVGLSVGNGAVFWMDPQNAPTGVSRASRERRLVLAQLTIPSGMDWTATIAAQGHTVDWTPDTDWEHGTWDQALVFEHTCPHSTPTPATEKLDAGEEAATPCSELQLAVLRRCAADCTACDANKVAVVLGGCALPAGTSAAEVPCAGFVATFAPAVPPASMIASVDVDGDDVYDLDGTVWLGEGVQDLDRTVWSPSVSEDGPEKSGPTGAGAVAPGAPGAVSLLAAAEVEAPGLEEALAGQHGGMFKWMLSFVTSH